MAFVNFRIAVGFFKSVFIGLSLDVRIQRHASLNIVFAARPGGKSQEKSPEAEGLGQAGWRSHRPRLPVR